MWEAFSVATWGLRDLRIAEGISNFEPSQLHIRRPDSLSKPLPYFRKFERCKKIGHPRRNADWLSYIGLASMKTHVFVIYHCWIWKTGRVRYHSRSCVCHALDPARDQKSTEIQVGNKREETYLSINTQLYHNLRLSSFST